MNQRIIAAFLAMPLILALVLVATLKPLPFTSYGPGPTIDVLSAPNGKEIIQVQGQQTYRDTGQLRMTTVSVSPADSRMGLIQVMLTWLDRDDAVYPHDVVYPDNQSAEDAQQEGQVEMVSSQDTATAVALEALGDKVTPRIEVQGIKKGQPADGALALRDLFVAVDGIPLDSDINQAGKQLQAAIAKAGAGTKMTFTVLRDGKQVDVSVTPVEVKGRAQIGIILGEGYVLPFPVEVDINPQIGGPSAGLMFSLAIYDTLTPGSLTDGGRVAGTGEIADDGTVGPIGGIQQKIVGARQDGAQLFLVPSDNCTDAQGARNGDMRLAKVTTFQSALSIVQTWAKNHDAKLPECKAS